MDYFEKILLQYLWDGQLEMQISGLDMEGFQEAMKEEGKCRLEMIEQVVFEDSNIMSDTQKVETIRKLFREKFYYKE